MFRFYYSMDKNYDESRILEYIKLKKPDLYVKKKCQDIISKIKNVKLPNLDEHEKLIKKHIKIVKNLDFSSDNYGLALKFYKLREVFYRLYSIDENPDFLKILEYLKEFDYYFIDLVLPYMQKRIHKTDFLLNVATNELRFYIEYFCNKYDFIIKDRDAILEDLFDFEKF